MVNQSILVASPDQRRRHGMSPRVSIHYSSTPISMKEKEKDNNTNTTTTVVEKQVNGHSNSNGVHYDNNKKEKEENGTGDEVETLVRLNGESSSSHEGNGIRQKSATLTSCSSSGHTTTNGSAENSSFSIKKNGGGNNAFINNARNNLRRSFTLPRGLLPRRSGQTGPASENQNGSFLRNIFLTLGRGKSIRRKQPQEEIVNGHEELQGLPFGFTPAAVGLKNQGNTCFMNAIVQCLSHTDTLAKYLVTDNYKNDLRRKNWIKNGKSEIADELASVLKSAWLKQNANSLEDAVARFKSAVEKGALQWRGSEQHDAQEFFLWLLDKLHEDLNQATSNKYKQLKNNFGRPEEQVAAEALANHSRCNVSVIQDIFGAHFRSSLTCPGCGKQSATFDPFLCVSLPIPQAKQEVPVFVNVIYLSQQPRQVKLGMSVSSCADIKELKQLIAADTSIEEKDILLTEIDGEGFHRTFTETQLVSALSNNEALYCIETPQMRETTESDGAFLMITWTNIIVTEGEEKTMVRFGSTYVTQIARETSFTDLQKVLLKEMASIIQPGILVAEQKDPVFTIRILDGSSEGTAIDPGVEHPLYTESIDHALSLCDEDVPPHAKLHLEWTQKDKETIIADDSEGVEEHASVAQIRQRHSDESLRSVTLGECFDLYTSAEQLSAEDSWHCPHCNRKEQGTLKMIGLWTAPQVLVVHLKRFRQTPKGRVAATKISSVVDFPVDGLDLGPHVAKHKQSEIGLANGGPLPASSPINGCFGLSSWKHRASFKKQIVSSIPSYKTASSDVQSISEDGMIYDLYAVCNHHGKDVLGGHYTAYCKNPVDGSWWLFDDTRVAKLSSPQEITTASAYILFYTKRSSSVPTCQPFSPHPAQHWCKSLIKKYHKNPCAPPSSFGPSSIEDKNVDSKETIRSPSPKLEDDTNKSTSEVSGTITHSDSSTPSRKTDKPNTYYNNISADCIKSSSTAPLAMTDDVSVNGGNYTAKELELQIESTV